MSLWILKSTTALEDLFSIIFFRSSTPIWHNVTCRSLCYWLSRLVYLLYSSWHRACELYWQVIFCNMNMIINFTCIFIWLLAEGGVDTTNTDSSHSNGISMANSLSNAENIKSNAIFKQPFSFCHRQWSSQTSDRDAQRYNMFYFTNHQYSQLGLLSTYKFSSLGSN